VVFSETTGVGGVGGVVGVVGVFVGVGEIGAGDTGDAGAVGVAGDAGGCCHRANTIAAIVVTSGYIIASAPLPSAGSSPESTVGMRRSLGRATLDEQPREPVVVSVPTQRAPRQTARYS